MTLRKVIGWLVVIFLIYYLATNPTGAAHAMHSAVNGLKTVGHSLSTFVSSF